MNKEKIARRYAQAFFHASSQQHQLEVIEKDFQTVKQACQQSTELQLFIDHNEISQDIKENILKKIFENKIEKLTLSALRLLISKRREYLLTPIIHEFTKLYNNQKKYLEVHIYTADTLENTIKEQLINKFQNETKKKIIPVLHINPDLIGGIKIIYNDLQIDGSIQGKLHRLRENLIVDLLKQEQ